MSRSRTRTILWPIILLGACGTADDDGTADRDLATVAAALDEAPAPHEVLARQHELLEILDQGQVERLPDLIDLSFRMYDHANPPGPSPLAPGAGYVSSASPPMPGLNYYQFLSSGIPAGMQWTGRTMELAWSTPSVVLVVAHIDETDPLFTEWRLFGATWKAVRLTIRAPDETLHQARRGRRR